MKTLTKEVASAIDNAEPPHSWPHAPIHLLKSKNVYMITAGTYQKVHHYRDQSRLQRLHDSLLAAASEAGWELHAWAVFSNHYHFVAQSPGDPASLYQWIASFHQRMSAEINRKDGTPNRKVWYQYWDTALTHQSSYLARLHYVHSNAVKHGLVKQASAYPWCSASQFERYANKSFVRSVYRFKIDKVKVIDDF